MYYKLVGLDKKFKSIADVRAYAYKSKKRRTDHRGFYYIGWGIRKYTDNDEFIGPGGKLTKEVKSGYVFYYPGEIGWKSYRVRSNGSIWEI